MIRRRPARDCRLPRDRQRGAVMVLACLMLLMLGAFFTLAFNLGLLMDSRTQLQAAADSAALAAARSLDGEASGLDAARRAARVNTGEHRAYDQNLQIGDADITFGRWHFKPAECTFGAGADCFEPLDESDPRAITAVRVGNGRDGVGDHNAPIDLPFTAFIPTEQSSLAAQAVAVGGGAAAPQCALPFAVPECRILDDANHLRCGERMTLTFANANVDGIGFVNLYYPEERNNANPNWVEDEIRGQGCRSDRHSVGDAKLFDGNALINRVIEALRGVIQRGNGREQQVGDCLIGDSVHTLAVVNRGCPLNPYFHNVQEVVGFVNVRILQATDNQGYVWTCGPDPAPPQDGITQRSVTIQIECNQSPAGNTDPLGGGRVYNDDARLRLVQ
jgi:hypothetical protein